MILRVEEMKNFSFVFYGMCVEVSKRFKYEFISKPAKVDLGNSKCFLGENERVLFSNYVC